MRHGITRKRFAVKAEMSLFSLSCREKLKEKEKNLRAWPGKITQLFRAAINEIIIARMIANVRTGQES